MNALLNNNVNVKEYYAPRIYVLKLTQTMGGVDLPKFTIMVALYSFLQAMCDV